MRDKGRERIVKLIKGRSTKCTIKFFKKHCETTNEKLFDRIH